MARNFVQVTFTLKGLPSAIEDALKEDSRLKIGVMGSNRELGKMRSSLIVEAEPVGNLWRVTSRLPMRKTFQWAWAITSRDTRAVFTDPAGHKQSVLTCFSGVLDSTWGEPETVFSSLTCGAELKIHHHCQQGEVMAVTGSGAGFGFWGSKNAVRATEYPADSSNWTAEILLDSSLNSSEWKWVVLDSRSGEVTRWEKCASRHLEPVPDVLQVVETKWNNEDLVLDCDCHRAGDDKQVDKQDLGLDEKTNCLKSASGDQEEKLDQTARKPIWRMVTRRLPALLPFVYNWCRF